MNISMDSTFTSDKLARSIDQGTPAASGIFNNIMKVQRNPGVDHALGGPEIFYSARVTETFDVATSITVTLRTSDIEPTVPGTGRIIATHTIPAAGGGLTQGSHPISQHLPSKVDMYLWTEWACTGGTPTVGKFFIGMLRADDNWFVYPAHSYSDH